MSRKKVLDFDPYDVLGVDKDSDESQIIKAFRKAALKWHPDKNPDQQDYAQKMFHQISRALALLTDVAARAAYDQLQAARLARSAFIQRRQQTESQARKRFREELERREADAQQSFKDTEKAQENLEKEIERLRREGSLLLRKEQENVETEMKKRSKQARVISEQIPDLEASVSSEGARIKVKWKRKKNCSVSYDGEALKNIFGKFGDVSTVAVSPGGKPTAIIEFLHCRDAVLIEAETGWKDCPLRVSWLSKPGVPRNSGEISAKKDEQKPDKCCALDVETIRHTASSSALFDDFEAEVLSNMMSNAKRKGCNGSTGKFGDV
ncbi:hypothetical protein AB6A40_006073 [Gnathostoma spinigerum]|uniref:J domain-containing protein n=1 Tax=Gnathostoma spinigerum TaxID=75299 RepID=A0ABD6EHB3_9BILA